MSLARATKHYHNSMVRVMAAGDTFTVLSKGNDGWWEGKFSDSTRRLFPSDHVNEIAVFDDRPKFSVGGSVDWGMAVHSGDVQMADPRTASGDANADTAAEGGEANSGDGTEAQPHQTEPERAPEPAEGTSAEPLGTPEGDASQAASAEGAPDPSSAGPLATEQTEPSDGDEGSDTEADEGGEGVTGNEAPNDPPDGRSDQEVNGGPQHGEQLLRGEPDEAATTQTPTDSKAEVDGARGGMAGEDPSGDHDDHDDHESDWDREKAQQEAEFHARRNGNMDGSGTPTSQGVEHPSPTPEPSGSDPEDEVTASPTAQVEAPVGEAGDTHEGGSVLPAGLEDLTLQEVVALAPVTFSSLLGLNLLLFAAFLFGGGGSDKTLEKRYTDTLNAKTTLELQLDETKRKLDEAQARAAGQVHQDGRRVRELEASVATVTGERDRLLQQTAQLQQSAAAVTQHRDALQAQLNEMQTAHARESSEAAQRAAATTASVGQLTAELAEAKASTKSAREEITKVSADATSLRRELADAVAARGALEEQLSKKRTDEDIAEKYDLVKVALQEAQAQSVIAEARADRLQKASDDGDVAQLTKKARDLQGALDEAELALRSRTTELARLKKSLMAEAELQGALKGAAAPSAGAGGDADGVNGGGGGGNAAGEADRDAGEASSDGDADAENAGQSPEELVMSPSEAPPEVLIQGLQVLLENERETRSLLEAELAEARGTVKSLTAELETLTEQHGLELERVNRTNMELQVKVTGIKEIYDHQRETAETRYAALLLDKAKAEDARAVAEDNCRCQEEENDKLMNLLKEQDREAFAKQVARNDALVAELAMISGTLDEKKLQLKKAYAQIEELRNHASAPRGMVNGGPTGMPRRAAAGAVPMGRAVRAKPPPPQTPRPPNLGAGGAPVRASGAHPVCSGAAGPGRPGPGPGPGRSPSMDPSMLHGAGGTAGPGRRAPSRPRRSVGSPRPDGSHFL